MANITTLKKGTGNAVASRQDSNVAFIIDNTIDFADALVAKGSALAASDTIEALVLPAGTVVLAAGVQCIAVDDATLTLDLGFTGASPGAVDHFVDGFDEAAAVAGAYSGGVPDSAVGVAVADTLDLLFATLTGTLSVGKVRVWALVANAAAPNPVYGIAQVGS